MTCLHALSFISRPVGVAKGNVSTLFKMYTFIEFYMHLDICTGRLDDHFGSKGKENATLKHGLDWDLKPSDFGGQAHHPKIRHLR